MELCCWLALNITNWTQYQHRYAVPTQLIAKLVDTKNTDHSSQVQKSLIAMITAVFSAHTPIANLSTSDALTSLIGVILRRIASNPHDPLLLELVKCVSSLGTHLYYADQIHDLAEELIHRLTSVQVIHCFCWLPPLYSKTGLAFRSIGELGTKQTDRKACDASLPVWRV